MFSCNLLGGNIEESDKKVPESIPEHGHEEQLPRLVPDTVALRQPLLRYPGLDFHLQRPEINNQTL